MTTPFAATTDPSQRGESLSPSQGWHARRGFHPGAFLAAEG
jgi:hypothetical protein